MDDARSRLTQALKDVERLYAENAKLTFALRSVEFELQQLQSRFDSCTPSSDTWAGEQKT